MYKIPKDLLKRQREALDKHFNQKNQIFRGASFRSITRGLRKANALRRQANRVEKSLMRILEG